jgi:homeobox-leucine zipper protein
LQADAGRRRVERAGSVARGGGNAKDEPEPDDGSRSPVSGHLDVVLVGGGGGGEDDDEDEDGEAGNPRKRKKRYHRHTPQQIHQLEA